MYNLCYVCRGILEFIIVMCNEDSTGIVILKCFSKSILVSAYNFTI